MTYKEVGVGAATIVALSVVPVVGLIAPLIGGGVAGWHSRASSTESALVGAGAGVVASLVGVPVVLAGVAFAASVSGPAALGVFSVAVSLWLYTAGLGALGGYAGRWIAAESSDDPHRDPRVERLRNEYLAGMLTRQEFERRLEETLDGNAVTSDRPTPEEGDGETRTTERL
ncbi:MAG: DUF5518 domain-containing protein [Halobaculum sp.]